MTEQTVDELLGGIKAEQPITIAGFWDDAAVPLWPASDQPRHWVITLESVTICGVNLWTERFTRTGRYVWKTDTEIAIDGSTWRRERAVWWRRWLFRLTWPVVCLWRERKEPHGTI